MNATTTFLVNLANSLVVELLNPYSFVMKSLKQLTISAVS